MAVANEQKVHCNSGSSAQEVFSASIAHKGR